MNSAENRETRGHAFRSAFAAKIPLTHRTGAKAVAFVLVLVSSLIAVLCMAAAVLMIEEDVYFIDEYTLSRELLESRAASDAYLLIGQITNGDIESVETYLSRTNITAMKVTSDKRGGVSWQYGDPMDLVEPTFSSTWDIINMGDGEFLTYFEDTFEDSPDLQHVTVTIGLDWSLPLQDEYALIWDFVEVIYDLRYAVWFIGAGALLLFFAALFFLLCASGRRADSPVVQPGWCSILPYDLLTLGVGFGLMLLWMVVLEMMRSFDWIYTVIILFIACGITEVMLLGWLMSTATRIKLGRWWENTLCMRMGRILWQLCRKGLKLCAAVFRGIRQILEGIPYVLKTVVIVCGVIFFNLMLILACRWEPDVLLFCCTLEGIAVFLVTVYIALRMRDLQKGGEALASGELSYQVDTRRMFWDFKKHGENLNRIGEGMALAVEKRLQSERMKTELITNVSHDLKTPLTSIINYADLIGKEPCENPKITEYSEVLLRQSDRLKRLIDDLVEASKASTGNLEVQLIPFQLGVLLTQTAGEYEQRLRDRRLELVVLQPEKPIKILADGRRMWRVFDNLMNNICKYSLEGSRVYLTLEETEGEAIVSFKNTSKAALNLSEEELLERFVRGDTARSSEGSGLGLSIAKSLTELQNGSFALTVDGDLFKAVLRFPILNPQG